MPFRFVHTADVHLDSPLRSLALRDSDLAELIGDATRIAFERTIDLCLDERVDALMIAGDLYDGDQTSMKTALFLAAQLRRLDEAGIRTFIVRGNHDAASRITRELTLPESVTVFGGRGAKVELERSHDEYPVAVHGISFAKPHAPDSLVSRFRAPVAGAFNIGLLHTSLGGAAGHDPYAPCSVSELVDAGFDYWCLGHVHKREVHRENPFVVMPGMPQGRDINEDGPKSVTMVRIGDDGAVECRAHPTNVAQFERVSVDLGGVEAWRDVAGRIGNALERTRADVDADHLVARLQLSGETGLAWELLRDPDRVTGEADLGAYMAGCTWVEKIELSVSAPSARGNAAGPIGDLATTMRGPVAQSDAFRREARDRVEEIERALPPEARRILGDSEAARDAIVAGLIAEGCDAVLAHLRGSAAERAD